MKNHMIWILLLACTLLCGQPAVAAVQGTEVSYRQGDVVLKGYLARDDALTGPRPGILVVHEWWGHNEYARKRARLLASLGYVALAVDMYGAGQQATHPEDAGRFAKAATADMQVTEARFRAALDLLHAQADVDKDQTAAIGYCFGGGIVLNMARRGVDLDGVVSFHGSLGTQQPAQKNRVKAQVLVFNGAADTFVTAEQIAAFRQEMQTAGVDYRFVDFPGVKHSFTNPDADRFGERFSLPLAYDLEADYASWQQMRSFFDGLFGEGADSEQ